MHETANVFPLIQITRGQGKRKVQKTLNSYFTMGKRKQEEYFGLTLACFTLILLKQWIISWQYINLSVKSVINQVQTLVLDQALDQATLFQTKKILLSFGLNFYIKLKTQKESDFSYLNL